ncbi:hypothetical protein F2P79_012278 [Pimephales promelas]|nr:hypothetical protein F2P79_012278 [Pimephales promelas]
MGNSKVVKSPSSLKECGSRAHVVRAGDPDYLYSVLLNLTLNLMLYQRGSRVEHGCLLVVTFTSLQRNAFELQFRMFLQDWNDRRNCSIRMNVIHKGFGTTCGSQDIQRRHSIRRRNCHCEIDSFTFGKSDEDFQTAVTSASDHVDAAVGDGTDWLTLCPDHSERPIQIQPRFTTPIHFS